METKCARRGNQPTPTQRLFGSLPAPQLLRAYEGLLPEAPSCLLNAWLEEVLHRRAAELERERAHRDLQGARIIHQRRGQIFGLVVALGSLAVAAFALYLGYPGAATGIISIELVTLVRAFMRSPSPNTRLHPQRRPDGLARMPRRPRPHLRVNNSIRVRPEDLANYVAGVRQ